MPAKFDAQNGDEFVKVLEAFEKSDARQKTDIRGLLEKTKLLKMLSNGSLCDKSYKNDMRVLLEKLKEHENFEDKDEGKTKVNRLKLMLGPVKDFKRA